MTNRNPSEALLAIQKNLMYVAVTRAKQTLSIYNNIKSEVNTWLLKAIRAGVVSVNTDNLRQSSTLSTDVNIYKQASQMKSWFQSID